MPGDARGAEADDLGRRDLRDRLAEKLRGGTPPAAEGERDVVALDAGGGGQLLGGEAGDLCLLGSELPASARLLPADLLAGMVAAAAGRSGPPEAG